MIKARTIHNTEVFGFDHPVKRDISQIGQQKPKISDKYLVLHISSIMNKSPPNSCQPFLTLELVGSDLLVNISYRRPTEAVCVPFAFLQRVSYTGKRLMLNKREFTLFCAVILLA